MTQNKLITILAPMDDVTDVVFRTTISKLARPTLSMTEFVNVDGLASVGRPRLVHRMFTSNEEAPVILQLWGKNPENFRKIITEIASGKTDLPGKFVGIDLNFGCPEKTVVKNKCCSALIQKENWHLAKEIIDASAEAIKGTGLSFSIKTRLGFTVIDHEWHRFLLGFPIDMLTIHARTRKEMSKVPAHYEDLRPIVAMRDSLNPKVKLIGNGDIMNYDQATQTATEIGLDGIMIGRGVFSNPYCFSPEYSKWDEMSPEQKIKLFSQQLELYPKYYKNNERKFDTIKKFVKIYISGFEKAAEMRAEIMTATDIDQIQQILAKSLR